MLIKISTKVLWGLSLAVVCLISVAGTWFIAQKNELLRLAAREQQLVLQTQSMAGTQQRPVEQASEKPKDGDLPVEGALAQEKEKIRKSIIDSLGKIEGVLADLDRRMEVLEQERNIAQVNDVDESDSYEAHEENPNDENSVAELVEKEDLKHYFSSVEQTILQTADEQFTQQVQSTFESMVSSREDWSQNTAVKSSECGAEYCKVVLNYKNDMDPISQFEFDGMAYIWNPELPSSRSQYKKNSDGTTDLIIYSARKGSKLPPL